MKRWNKKELAEMSSVDFIIEVLKERWGKCTNPYSPLAERLERVINKLAEERKIEEE